MDEPPAPKKNAGDLSGSNVGLGFVVFDQFVCGEQVVACFPTELAAEQWLAGKIEEDDDGYAGCIILKREDVGLFDA